MTTWIIPLISAAGSLGGALVGAFVGGWLSDRREATKRSADLMVRQLMEFYGPLKAAKDETDLYSDLLARMNEAAECSEKSRTTGMASTTGGFPEEMQLKGNDLEVIKGTLMPIYRNMIKEFRSNMSIANPTAHAYFPILCQYVESWVRRGNLDMPSAVRIVAGQSEKVLQPFYTHLCDTHTKLSLEYKKMVSS
jgi:hypothetical protein